MLWQTAHDYLSVWNQMLYGWGGTYSLLLLFPLLYYFYKRLCKNALRGKINEKNLPGFTKGCMITALKAREANPWECKVPQKEFVIGGIKEVLIWLHAEII